MPQNNTARFGELLATPIRFPLPFLCAVALTIHKWPSSSSPYFFSTSDNPNVDLFLIAAFFWTWSAALWGEAQTRPWHATIGAILGLFALYLAFHVQDVFHFWIGLTPVADQQPLTPSHSFLLGALALAPAIAPYLTRSPPLQSAFWQYNHKWAIALGAAAAGSLLAYAGFAAIVETSRLLFQFQPRLLYDEGLAVSSALVFPWIWLTLTPRDLSETVRTGDAKEFTSRAVSLLVSYILIPVATVLSFLLAVYAVKSIVSDGFSTSRLGLLSVSYGAGIVQIALLAYPQRQESRYVRIFWRVFPYLLIAPCVLFFPALWIRVSEYGWTPQRYFSFVAGCWLAAVALLSIFTRWREDLRLIPGILCALLAASAFGPWGVSQVSARSQYARLEKIVTGRGWLVDGKWHEPDGQQRIELSSPDFKTISSAVNVLNQTDETDRTRPWFSGQQDDPFATTGILGSHSRLYTKLIYGRDKLNEVPKPGVFIAFGSYRSHTFTTEAQTFVMGPISPTREFWSVNDTPIGPLKISGTEQSLTLEDSSFRRAVFDYRFMLEQLPKNETGSVFDNPPPPLKDPQALPIFTGDGDLPAKIAVINMMGLLGPDKVAQVSSSVYILVPVPPEPAK